jgi:hypothetical protein
MISPFWAELSNPNSTSGEKQRSLTVSYPVTLNALALDNSVLSEAPVYGEMVLRRHFTPPRPKFWGATVLKYNA